MKNEIDYCPNGSVVLLKGSPLKIMIVGTVILNLQSKGVVYDYMGCKYPEGFLDKESLFYFNHKDIETVLFLGLENQNTKETFLKYKKLY